MSPLGSVADMDETQKVKPAHLCIVIGRRIRPGKPYRVWHWHWPKTDIVNCENAKEALSPDAAP
jgi:hypothetical protein